MEERSKFVFNTIFYGLICLLIVIFLIINYLNIISIILEPPWSHLFYTPESNGEMFLMIILTVLILLLALLVICLIILPIFAFFSHLKALNSGTIYSKFFENEFYANLITLIFTILITLSVITAPAGGEGLIGVALLALYAIVGGMIGSLIFFYKGLKETKTNQ